MELTAEERFILMSCQLQLQKTQVENSIMITKAKLRQAENRRKIINQLQEKERYGLENGSPEDTILVNTQGSLMN